jgi:hypothetical protein
MTYVHKSSNIWVPVFHLPKLLCHCCWEFHFYRKKMNLIPLKKCFFLSYIVLFFMSIVLWIIYHKQLHNIVFLSGTNILYCLFHQEQDELWAWCLLLNIHDKRSLARDLLCGFFRSPTLRHISKKSKWVIRLTIFSVLHRLMWTNIGHVVCYTEERRQLFI